MVTEYNRKKAEKLTGGKCEVCGTELYSDPGQHELGIYLHAKRYACMGDTWSYETGLPEWSLPPSGVDGPTDVTEESDPLAAEVAKLDLEDKPEGEVKKAEAVTDEPVKAEPAGEKA
jgi:tRNA pseudouridine synthase 9